MANATLEQTQLDRHAVAAKTAGMHLQSLLAEDLEANPGHVELSGYLMKRRSSFPYSWDRRWFVLYNDTATGRREIRYYKRMVRASFGNLPIDERGEIPMRLIHDIVDVQAGKYGGGLFTIKYEQYGTSHYSGVFSQADVDSSRGDFKPHLKDLQLMASDAHEKDAWMTFLKAARDPDSHIFTPRHASAKSSTGRVPPPPIDTRPLPTQQAGGVGAGAGAGAGAGTSAAGGGGGGGSSTAGGWSAGQSGTQQTRVA